MQPHQLVLKAASNVEPIRELRFHMVPLIAQLEGALHVHRRRERFSCCFHLVLGVFTLVGPMMFPCCPHLASPGGFSLTQGCSLLSPDRFWGSHCHLKGASGDWVADSWVLALLLALVVYIIRTVLLFVLRHLTLPCLN